MRNTLLHIGVVGCGTVALAVHIPLLRRLAGARVTAIAERDSKRRDLAQRLVPQARAFDDYRELVECSGVDAVMVCLPTGLHAEAATKVLDAGESLYLEKPIAASMAGARLVLDAWQSAGVAGMMGFNLRFNPLHLAARRLLKSGRLGELVAVRTVFSSSDRNLPAWKRSRAEGGGAVLDLAGHHMDLLRFFLDREFTHVGAQLRSSVTEHDTAALELRADGGLMVQSHFALGGVDEDRIEFYGREGILRVDRYGANGIELVPKHARHRLAKCILRGWAGVARLPYLISKLRSPWHEPSYEAALRHFVGAVRGGSAPRPDLHAGFRSLAVTEAAEASAASGRMVEVSYDR